LTPTGRSFGFFGLSTTTLIAIAAMVIAYLAAAEITKTFVTSPRSPLRDRNLVCD
jgi:hypothetical protein